MLKAAHSFCISVHCHAAAFAFVADCANLFSQFLTILPPFETTRQPGRDWKNGFSQVPFFQCSRLQLKAIQNRPFADVFYEPARFVGRLKEIALVLQEKLEDTMQPEVKVITLGMSQPQSAGGIHCDNNESRFEGFAYPSAQTPITALELRVLIVHVAPKPTVSFVPGDNCSFFVG
jgi:hypothetical protein